MVMTARALHEAYGRLLDNQSSPGTPSAPALATGLEQLYVPWQGGLNVSGADQWGFTWFQRAISFDGINTTGNYLIENFTDSYLVLGVQPPAIEQLPSNGQGLIVPPFTAGIYSVGITSFVATNVCAGYDFTSARTFPGPNASWLDTRGPTAHVHIASLGPSDMPSAQPSLRNGWVRRYDWYDFSAPPHSAVVLNAGAGINLPACDFTGAKSVMAYCNVSLAGGATCQLTIRAQSPFGGQFYTLGQGSTSAAGPQGFNVAATQLYGLGIFVNIQNTAGAGTVTLSDANVEVTF